jgi:hydrogenase/urease accessory protein HupE
VARAVTVTADGEPCAGFAWSATPTEQDGLEIRVTYTCREDASRIELVLGFLGDLPYGHRHVAHVSSGSYSFQEVCYRGHDRLLVPAPAKAAPAAHPAGFVAFLRMGVEHILTGYDHLLFLFGLVVVGGRLRSLLLVVTAFTVAHSITLALAATDVWAPSPRVVEPMIALSIVYVGVENFFVPSPDTSSARRWRVTFPFGLVHGFGFAGALRQVELARAEVPGALVGFNLGVEIGQIAVLCALLPIVLRLRKEAWFAGEGRPVSAVRALSAAVALAGALLLVQRLV